ncbi:CRISPR-associated RAMP protein (TIGR02581 family) [Desulfofundulus luciae]|uniref:CRISPR-associated RAMP protein (TIGR02581 family) n=1 Tax=Desulfofundulus luciae TaxID=74702 RepID=A0ABU0AYJ1_9FIRM|nr:CRISPR-associated RAMP protein Csx7 [Desulfofundulus luciae]MDQ0285539.1 CRISPR-associated RAMP protein (TIGR02581 family) [Desulfofundulus luciae]
MAAAVSFLYDTFYNRRRITGRLVTLTPLRIGSGEAVPDPTAIDNPVIRDAYGRPFIPGSSFKGVWRSFAEQVLGQRDNGDRGCCDPLSAPCLPAEEVKKLKREHNDLRRLAGEIYTRLCPACRIFGSPHFAGRLRVRDLLLDESTWPGFCEVRPGVAIDRDTRTAYTKRKYEIEAVPAGTAFTFEAVVENAGDEEWRGILLTLLPFTRGELPLGGCTGRGLGRVRLENIQVASVTASNLREFLTLGWNGISAADLQNACSEAGLFTGGATGV